MARWMRNIFPLLVSLIFFLGCVNPASDVYYFKDINQTGADSNQVKVSSNDTTSGYLNGKLVAGSNITLTENNDGGNETLTIASTASAGGGGTIYTSGTPSTIQVNNDSNTISQNFDGNFYSKFVSVFDSNFFYRNIGDMNWIIFNTFVNPAGGIVDANISNDLTIASTKNATFSLDLNVGTRLSAQDINGTRGHFDTNLTVDKNALIKQDLNIQNMVGVDKNINMNTSGACLKIKSTTGYTCFCGNNIDGNGGIMIYVCQ